MEKKQNRLSNQYMQNNNTSTSLLVATSDKMFSQKGTINYASILQQYGAEYNKVDYYWQVGKTANVQGWILHLSIIVPQIIDLLHILLPLLITKKTAFKLPKDKTIARNILEGNAGYEQLGKVISIYPEDENNALALAKQLVDLTAGYRGPAIPTDIHLGGCVYTRYGGINPIMRQGKNGQMEKYIYNTNGELVKDSYQIPFQLPVGISWPFGELTAPEVAKANKNLRHIYKPINILKPDARGNVVKALYLKGLFRIGTCVIKAGKKNMLADDMGRDIQDRLIWQRHLHEELGNMIRLPKILDFFEENGEFYLIMEFIKGKSLHDSLVDIHKNQRSWFQVSIKEQLIILGWLSKILNTISLLHSKGFVHRDIAPGNFIIDEQGELVLIDVELAYDLNNDKKEIPFELGTPGFMSPEQEAISIPTVQEDIYGLGALMINCFTCLSAMRFNSKDSKALLENLMYFIRNRELAELICKSLSILPSERPSIRQIQFGLEHYKMELHATTSIRQKETIDNTLYIELLQMTIADALQGMSKEPMPIHDGLWLSRTIQTDSYPGNTQKDFSPYCGIHTGMAGILYLLAQAKKIGYELNINKQSYKQCWKYIHQEHLNNLESLTPGLYHGAAGIALAIIKGLEADILEDSDLIREYIHKCLEKPNNQLNIAEGHAGVGLVLLQCKQYLPEAILKKLLDKCVQQLLSHQKKDGSWGSVQSAKSQNMSLSWSQGLSGIIYFLIACYSHNENQQVLDAVNKSLTYLLKQTQDLQGLFHSFIFQKLLNKQPEIGDERTGVILCCIQAYSFIKNPYFKEVAEKAMYQYPDFVVNSNFSQDGGLSALGELYWEAWRTFKNDEWERRAIQIASVLLHTSYWKKGESCYWLMDETGKPTADLFSGNSGIIHFLIRCNDPQKLGYILSP